MSAIRSTAGGGGGIGGTRNDDQQEEDLDVLYYDAPCEFLFFSFLRLGFELLVSFLFNLLWSLFPKQRFSRC